MRITVPSRRCKRAGLMFVFLAIWACVASNVAADGIEDPNALRRDIGMLLKAAVVSDAITDEEAVKLYMEIVARDGNEEKNKEKKALATPSGQRQQSISPPEIDRVMELYRPAFMRRDMSIIVQRLDLDDEQSRIVEQLIDDHVRAYTARADEVREMVDDAALTREGINAFDMLRRFRTVRIDPEALEAGIREMHGRNPEADDKRRGALDDYHDELRRAARDADARIERLDAALRQRYVLAPRDADRRDILAVDIRRAAEALARDRHKMRARLIEHLALIALTEFTEDERRLFDETIERIECEQMRDRGVLGGESMNLDDAVNRAVRELDDREQRAPFVVRVRSIIDDGRPMIVTAMRERSAAMIDCDLAHIAIRVARASDGAGDVMGTTRLMTRRTEAARSLLAARVRVRDALFHVLDEAVTPRADVDPVGREAAFLDRVRTLALEDGFPTEMRDRWFERRLAEVARLTDLTEEQREAVDVYRQTFTKRIRDARNAAIAARLRDEARLAERALDPRADMTSIFLSKSIARGYGEEALSKIEFQAYFALRDILTTEQMRRIEASISSK